MVDVRKPSLSTKKKTCTYYNSAEIDRIYNMILYRRLKHVIYKTHNISLVFSGSILAQYSLATY